MNFTTNFSELIKGFDRIAAGLPGNSARGAREHLFVLRELYLASRPPALMLLGQDDTARRNFVKSLFRKHKRGEPACKPSSKGFPSWRGCSSRLGTINLLELDDAGDQNPEAALERQKPDCIVVMTDQVRAERNLSKKTERWKRTQDMSSGRGQPGALLLFLVEEQDKIPGGTGVSRETRTYQGPEKIKQRLEQSGLGHSRIIMVPANFFSSDYISRGDDFIIKERIILELADTLPLSARLQFARLCGNKDVQKQVADQTIKPMAVICGAIALNPLPVADIMPMTSAQLAMVSAVGCVAGREMSRKTALEFLSAAGMNIGGAFALREASRALGKIVAPLIGSAASAGIAYTGTLALGKAAAAYFIDEKPSSRVRDILGQFRKKA